MSDIPYIRPPLLTYFPSKFHTLLTSKSMDTNRKFVRLTIDDSLSSPIGPPVGTPTYKISNVLTYTYAALQLLMLGVGLALTAFSLMWIQSGVLHHMVLADGTLPGVLLVGSLFISTFLLSILGLLHIFTLSPSRPFSTLPLDILSYVLLFDEITTVSVGVMIWWRTLRERALFATYWDNGSSSFRSMLESDVSCLDTYLLRVIEENSMSTSLIAVGITHAARILAPQMFVWMPYKITPTRY